MSTKTTTTSHTVTVHVPDLARITEVQAEVTRTLDEHSIVESVGGSGHVITFRVTFGTMAEVAPLVRAAHNAALHVTPCDVSVSTR